MNITDIVIGILTLGITSAIQLKIKYAPSEEIARRYITNLLASVFLILVAAHAGHRLIEEFSSPAMLDKKSLMYILLNSFVLFYLFVYYYLNRILSIIEKMAVLLVKK